MNSVELKAAKPTVLVVDDDVGLREALRRLLYSVGLEVRLFASIPEFLRADRPKGPTCLVLDVRLPGHSGLDLQRELAASNSEIPIIFITGYGDIPMSVQAMKGGAMEFLTKPFRDQDLLDAIQIGLARDGARLENEKALTRDEVLDNVTLTWLTKTFVSGARLYWECIENKISFFGVKGVSIPAAVSVFPDELYQAPKSWAERAYPKLIHYNKPDKGGHFAAWEQPKLFSEEVRAGFRSLRTAERTV